MGWPDCQVLFVICLFVCWQLVFDYQPGDVFACVADIGWITGHSYAVYGPLSNGGTTVLFESVPTYPDPGNTVDPLLVVTLNTGQPL